MGQRFLDATQLEMRDGDGVLGIRHPDGVARGPAGRHRFFEAADGLGPALLRLLRLAEAEAVDRAVEGGATLACCRVQRLEEALRLFDVADTPVVAGQVTQAQRVVEDGFVALEPFARGEQVRLGGVPLPRAGAVHAAFHPHQGLDVGVVGLVGEREQRLELGPAGGGVAQFHQHAGAAGAQAQPGPARRRRRVDRRGRQPGIGEVPCPGGVDVRQHTALGLVDGQAVLQPTGGQHLLAQ